MNPFEQPINTLTLSNEVLHDASKLSPKSDWIFDATALEIDEIFVQAYQQFLAGLVSDKHSRVLVAKAEYLGLFPDSCIVVPTLGEAEDLIEMERIERDLGF